MSSRTAQVLLLAITLLALGRICGHEFINWDDPYTIVQNSGVAHATRQSLAYYWTHGAMGLWIPLTYTLWAALAKVSEVGSHALTPNPWIFHAVSILMHCISALAVYRIARRVVPAKSAWPACAGAMIFAVHPVQVEAVAWASGMKDVLAGMFVLLAIERHVRTIDQKQTDWLSLLYLALALLAKPSAVVGVPIVAIIDRCLLNQSWKALAIKLLPWCVLALPIAIVARFAQSTVGVPPIDFAHRPLIAADALAFYLWKLFCPIDFAPDYGHLASTLIGSRELHWSWIAPLAIAVLLVTLRNRARPLLAGALIFVAGLLPVLSFTPFLFQFYSTVADHYVYVSMLGIAIAVAWIVRLDRMYFALLPITLLAALAFRQAGHWRNSEELFRHTLRINPDSVAAENNLGAYFASMGDYSHAVEYYDRALKLSPNYRLAHSNLAQLYALQGNMNLALEHFEKALEQWDATPPGLSPRDSTSEHLQFAQLLEKLGRHTQAVQHLQKILADHPDNVEARALLDKIRGTTQPTR